MIYAAPDSKHFSFSKNDTDSITESFFDRIRMWMDICNGSSDVISDTCIRNDDDWIGTGKHIKKQLEKLSTNLYPEENLLLRESEDGNIPLR